MLRSLVGSEMCIRDSLAHLAQRLLEVGHAAAAAGWAFDVIPRVDRSPCPVSYTHLTLPTIYSV